MSVRKLSPELQEKAKKEINEDPERAKDDIRFIKEWLKKQPHIQARMDDQWLLTFLRGCKFSLERTKEKLDMYYTMRKMLPEFFLNRDPYDSTIQTILKKGICLPLPLKDPMSPRIMLIRSGMYDSSELSTLDVYKTNMMIIDIMMAEDDEMMINGLHIVQDMQGITLNHMTSPAMSKKTMTYFQEALPNRPKGVHFFRLPSFFESIFSVIRPFIKDKMKNRINIHTEDFKTLYEQIPQSQFPEEYGGEAGSIEELAEIWKKKVESYSEWFKEDAKHGTNESLRPGKPKTSVDLFGIEGSFRKLNVD